MKGIGECILMVSVISTTYKFAHSRVDPRRLHIVAINVSLCDVGELYLGKMTVTQLCYTYKSIIRTRYLLIRKASLNMTTFSPLMLR